MKIKGEDGQEMEVFTADEVAARETAAREAAVTENKVQLDTALADKAKLEADLAAARNTGGAGSQNFAALKEALDRKDTQIKELQETSGRLEQNRVNDIVASELGRLARGDKELEKKVLHHFENTLKSVKAETREQIANKLESALKLSVDGSGVDLVNGANYAGGIPGAGGGAPGQPSYEPPSQNERTLGSKLGITEDDWKKYGPKTNKGIKK